MKQQVMLCKDWDPSKFVKGSLLSAKEDGVRAFFYPDESHLISRSGKPLLGLDHLVYAFRDTFGYLDLEFDMELHVPGMSFNEASGLIRNHNEELGVVASIFDIPNFGGEFIWRADYMNLLKTEHPMDRLPMQFLKNFPVTLQNFNKLYQACLKANYEGVVIKTPGHLYRNARSYDWMREVPIKSADCLCTGVYEGNGKMWGIAGGINIDFNGLKGKCGTMKDTTYEDREHMLLHPDEYIGRTCIIEYKELQASGMPRQPRFKGWRYDK